MFDGPGVVVDMGFGWRGGSGAVVHIGSGWG